MEKYIQLAKDLGMVNAFLLTPNDIVFDIRGILKCRWGCEDFSEKNIRCHSRNTSLDERMNMLKKYKNILLFIPMMLRNSVKLFWRSKERPSWMDIILPLSCDSAVYAKSARWMKAKPARPLER